MSTITPSTVPSAITSSVSHRPGRLTGLAAVLLILACGFMWLYGLRVVVPQLQAQTSASSETPLFSDFYMTWRAAAAWLGQGSDPYSPAVAGLISAGEAGALPPDTRSNYIGFFYPLYFAWLVSPLTLIPYRLLTPFVYIAMFGLMAFICWGWASLTGPIIAGRKLTVLLVGCSLPPALGAILVQQPVVISLAAMTGAIVALARRQLLLAGMLLAVATIKPQNCLLLLPLLSLWVLADWRKRYQLALGFGATLLALTGICLLLMPSWLTEWLAALQRYSDLAPSISLLSALLPPSVLLILGVVGGAGALRLMWLTRASAPDAPAFLLLCAWPLWASYLVFPSWDYQWLLIYPAILLMLGQRAVFAQYGRIGRSLYASLVTLVGMPLIIAPLALLLPADQIHTLLWLPLILLALFLFAPLLLVTRHSLKPRLALQTPTLQQQL